MLLRNVIKFILLLKSSCSLKFLSTLSVRNIRFEALQSEAGKKLLRRSGRAPDDISSVVLVEKERYV